jgi:hypothetical protein
MESKRALPEACSIDTLGSFSRASSTPESRPVVNRPSVAGVYTAKRFSGSGNGNGRKRAAFTVLKMAVVAPIPTASVAMAARANPGCRRHDRIVNLRSLSIAD